LTGSVLSTQARLFRAPFAGRVHRTHRHPLALELGDHCRGKPEFLTELLLVSAWLRIHLSPATD
jgi:hypothetical protein